MSKEERKKNVIEVLNKARSMELQAISQYMNQHYKLDDIDFGELAGNLKLIAIDEMRHAEMLAERIKELGGEPTTELSGPVVKNQETKIIFSHDAKQEDDTIDAYNQFLNVCRENADTISARLFETLIDDEQTHLSWFENIHDHIEDLGSAYLSRIAGTPSSTGLTPQGFVIKKAGGA